MSVKSMSPLMQQRRSAVTPEELRVIQQLILRWGIRTTERYDVIPTVVPRRECGDLVTARFIPSTGQVLVPQDAFRVVKDPSGFRGINEFIAKHPALAGRWLHEFGHARFSFDHRFMAEYLRKHGKRKYDTLILLSEGHCESQLRPYLNDIEKIAQQAAVMELILDDLPEGDEGDPDLGTPQSAIRLMALLASRLDAGIVDVGEPKSSAVYTAMVKALGEYFIRFYDVAAEFARIKVDPYLDYETPMNDCVDRWLYIADEMLGQIADEDSQRESLPPLGNSEGEGEPTESEPESGEGEPTESGEGEEPTESEGEPCDSESESESGEGEGDEGEGESGEGEGEGDGEGDGEGEGEGGSGESESESESGDGEGSGEGSEPNSGTSQLGDEGEVGGEGNYASGSEGLREAMEEAIESLRDAAKSAESTAKTAMPVHVEQLAQADAHWVAQRRAMSKEAKKRWR